MTDPVGERPRMPGYGVETERWQALAWSWAAQRLAQARNYWLVTVSGSGRPHVLPVWGVWRDDEKRFCFCCSPTARKAANLAVNPQVSFAPESTVEALTVEGVAAVVDDEGRREGWIDSYIAKYGGDLSRDFLRENLMVEVTPDRAIGIIERDDEFARTATRWRLG